MENLSTIIVAAIIILIVAAIVFKGIRNKKQGRCSCGCGCSGCGMSDVCNAEKDK